MKTWTYNIIYGVLIQVLLPMSLGRGKVWMGGGGGGGGGSRCKHACMEIFSKLVFFFFSLFFFFFFVCVCVLHCFVVVLLSVKTSQILPSRHSM